MIHPSFVPSLRGKASSFSLLSMMLTIGFLVVLYQVEEVSLYSQFAESFFFFFFRS